MEIWKDVIGYEGYYQVSSHGRVKRLETTVKANKGGTMVVRERILAPRITKYGYSRIKLCKYNVEKNIFAHRLVANAFMTNPNEYRVVNHKDGNKLNNHISNLEWCTHKENIVHAIEIGLIDMDKKRAAASLNGKKTVHNIHGWNKKLVLNVITGIYYDSITNAAKSLNLNRRWLNSLLSDSEKNKSNFVLV